MDYILMAIQLISMGLTWTYINYFLMALLAKENTKSENNNNKKYAWKLLLISVVACIISILNLLNCDFVSISEIMVVFRMYIVFLIANVFINRGAFKDAVYTKSQKYEKKVKIGTVILFFILTIYLVCTLLKSFYI